MATTKKLAKSQMDKKREFVLREMDAQRMTAVEASRSLGLSERQVRRLLAAYRQEGAAAVVHGNRGRTPTNALTPDVRQTILDLAQTTYVGFNQTHFTEKLHTNHRLSVSRATVQRVLDGAGVASPRHHRRPQHRSRRERRPCPGMLLQVDGSHHDWLEGRGPYLTLLAGIDDATGEVPAATFRDEEDAHGYMLVLRSIVQSHGIPLAIYSDRHSIFVHTESADETIEEQLAGQRSSTQVGRILEELGIQLILALSPQAKGRVERLWGTFQDRLVSELRLAKASTREEANAVLATVLPQHNERFARPPKEITSCYRAVPASLNLATVFSFQYERTVANDNTVRFGSDVIQIPANRERSSYARVRSRICVGLDGSITVLWQGRRIAHQPSSDPNIVLRAQKLRR
ncbi:MAG: ISNCY family transposase [Dehalococcoidia bacterium]|nr:ISNCY family transposase [Dehalococcoidia bacterium]